MVVLIGAHGTGKSTLLEKFSKLVPRFYITDGVSRPAQKLGNQLGLPQRDIQLIMNELTTWTWNNAIDQESYISTRSIIDAIVYSEVMGYRDLADAAMEVFENSPYQKVKYFYIPVEFDLVDDGVRYMDKDFQKKIDQAMLRFIIDNQLRITTLSGSVQERVIKLINSI